jgi:hypothetical protein
MHYLTHELDEVYPWRITRPKTAPLSKGWRLEIALYGNATIAINNDPEDWWLDSLTLDASNGRYGEGAEKWEQTIEPGEPLFEVVKEYLSGAGRDAVEAEIASYFVELRESRLFDEGKERAKMRGVA